MNINFIDNDTSIILLFAMVVIFFLGIFIFVMFRWFRKGSRISSRMDQYVTPEVPTEEKTDETIIIPREIEGSLFSRTVKNWLSKVLQFLGRFTPENMVDDMEHKLGVAGNPNNMHAADFYAMRFFLFLAGIVLAFLINRDLGNFNITNLILGMLIIVFAYLLPDVWLRGKMRARQDEIQRGLPDALDMLSVCASAGLGFDQSLQKISSYWDTELGGELKRVTNDIEMGISRADALRNMSNRLEVDDLTRFIAIIIQAEKIGMGYAEVLHSQAAQLRVLRQFRAREIANKLPGKMILPLALFIFPAMIAVILGPAIPTLLTAF